MLTLLVTRFGYLPRHLWTQYHIECLWLDLLWLDKQPC